MRFRQFEVFRSLMASGTMTRAASALSISQPAVSRHVAELEAHLGFQLFKRIRGRLEPTAAAVQLARVVEQNFLGLERIEHAAREIRDGLPQPVTVACLPALSTSLLPRVACVLRDRGRGLRLVVDSSPVSEMIERLRNLDADLALTLTFPPVVGIDAEPLFTVDHVCALPEGHRLCEREVIEPGDFRGEQVVGWSAAGPIGFEKEASTLAEHVASGNLPVTTHTSHTRYAMVAAGMGITIAEPFAALPWLGNGVVLRRFRPRLELSYSLCYPAARVRSESVHEVRDVVIEVARTWQDPTGGLVTLRSAGGSSGRRP